MINFFGASLIALILYLVGYWIYISNGNPTRSSYDHIWEIIMVIFFTMMVRLIIVLVKRLFKKL